MAMTGWQGCGIQLFWPNGILFLKVAHLSLIHILPRAMWAGIAAMSAILPFMEDMQYRVRKRIVGNIAGVICLSLIHISWILSKCASLAEVRRLLNRINIVNTPFSEQLPLAQLHWIISDENESITRCV